MKSLRWFLLILIQLPMPAWSWYFVHDTSAISQAVQNYRQLKNQYHLIESVKQNMQGHFGYGGAMNSTADLTKRTWTAKSWSDALHSLSGGNADRYHQLLQMYNDSNHFVSLKKYINATSYAQGNSYNQSLMTNRAVTAQASYEFNSLHQKIKEVHALSKKIEQARSEKAIMDLNARLTVELAYIQIQSLVMQSILNQQIADRSRDALFMRSMDAEFNALPPGEES